MLRHVKTGRVRFGFARSESVNKSVTAPKFGNAVSIFLDISALGEPISGVWDYSHGHELLHGSEPQ